MKKFILVVIFILAGCIPSKIIQQPSVAIENTSTSSSTGNLTATSIPKPNAVTVTPAPTATPTDLEILDERTLYLFGEPASNVINFFLEIQDCVKTDNKEKLAGLILYPITISSIDGVDTEIQNEDEFISHYDNIVTEKWKNVILSQEPTELFTNQDGVMVNRGELWFGPICLDANCSEKKYFIYSIVNDTPW